MSVVETLDIVLGARKSSSYDGVIQGEIRNINAFKTEINSTSMTLASFSPVAQAAYSSAGNLATSLPGVAIAAKIFTDVAGSIKTAFDNRQVAEANKLAKAVANIAAEAKKASKEIKQVQTELHDPRGSNIASAIHGRGSAMPIGLRDRDVGNSADDLVHAALYGSKKDMSRAYLGVGSMRSKKDQAAYEQGIDASLAQTATYTSSWKQAGAASTAATGMGVAGAATLAVGVGVVVAGVAALGYAWHKTSQEMVAIDEISDSAQKLGMTFRDLSNVRLSLAESSGLDSGQIDNAMQRMQVGLAEANTKQEGALFDALSAAGLNAAELLKMGPAKALEEISLKTQELKSPTDQLVLAYELFGKQGAALVTSLRDGPATMQDMAKWAEKVGMNLTQAQAEQVGAANDAWGRLEMVATGAWRQIAAEAAPVLTVIYENIAAGASEFSVYLNYLPDIIDNTVMFAGQLYDAWELADLIGTTLRNIVTLNWSEVGKDIEAAFTFDTGQKNLEAIQKARLDAANTANAKESFRGNGESQLAEYERQKEAEKELAAATKKRLQDEQESLKKGSDKLDALRTEIAVLHETNALRRAGHDVYDADHKLAAEINELHKGATAGFTEQLLAERRAAEMESDALKKQKEKFDSLQTEIASLIQINELRSQGVKFNEQDIRMAAEFAEKTHGQGQQQLEMLLARKQELEQFGKDQEAAKQIVTKYNPAEGLKEQMKDILRLRDNGLINQAAFEKASMEAAKSTQITTNRGAVSAQAGSVEAYKLMLEREKQNQNRQVNMQRIAEATKTILEGIRNDAKNAPRLRAAGS